MRIARRLGVHPLLGIGIASVVGLASCSTAGPSSGPPSASASRAAAIATVISDYFVRGIGGGDWGLASADSTGTLKVAAGWLLTQGISASEAERGTFVVSSMGVSSIGVSSATFTLEATQSGAGFTTTYSGPVKMVKESSGWKVADYLRDGRDAAAAIFPSVTGSATVSGVTVKAVGAQLEANHVDVWVQISNKTSGTLIWDQPIVVVDAAGRQLGHGFLFVSSADTSEPFEMLPNVSAFGDFLVESATLPVTTTSFSLRVGASVRGSHIDLSVPVTLH